MERHYQLMCAEVKKKNPNIKVVRELMDMEFNHRTNKIRQFDAKTRIKEACSAYPALTWQDEVCLVLFCNTMYIHDQVTSVFSVSQRHPAILLKHRWIKII